jgi:hypothetical protein
MITQLHDHIEMANNHVVDLTTSATKDVKQNTPTTLDTRKRPRINKNHSQERHLAKFKQDNFAATALTPRAVQTAIGSDHFDSVLVHDIVRAKMTTNTLTLQQNENLKNILHVDDNQLLTLETAYQAVSSHNPYYIANSIHTVNNSSMTPNVRVTPHSTAVKVTLKHMWSMLPENSIQSAAAMHRILMTAIRRIAPSY